MILFAQNRSINFDTKELLSDISSVVGDLGLGDGVTLESGLYYLAVGLLIIKTALVASKALTSGGEQPINFELLNPMITSALILALYPYLYSYFEAGVDTVLSYYDNTNLKAAETKNEFAQYVAQVKKAQSETDSEFSLNPITRAIDDAKNGMFNFTLDSAYLSLSIIDSAILYIFAFVAFLWLVVLKISAPLVIVLRLFKPTEGSLFLWIKNFISTSLWIPYASLVLVITNRVLITQVSRMMVNFDKRLAVGSFDYQLLIGIYLGLSVLMLVFILIKIVLITKVPQMIASFVGNTSSDGGFAMGFAAISFGKEAGTAVATKGGSLAGKGLGKLKK